MFEKLNRLGSQRTPFFFIIDFSMDNVIAVPAAQAAAEGFLFEFNGKGNSPARELPDRDFLFRRHPVPYERYRKAFDLVRREQTAGNSYLLNLTFPTRLETDLELEEIFHRSRARYRLLWKDRLTVFSPETFVSIRDSRIYSNPMKGTIDASIPDAAKRILADPKETAEHLTIVDLIRNDLNRIARGVRVEDYRYTEKIRTRGKDLVQVSTRISGDLERDWPSRIGTMLRELLPAGSISGAPKKKTVSIIREAEGYDRGFYTGIAGHFSGDSLDSCVLIRYIERTGGELLYKSGGGITVYSDPELEYNELVDKVYVPFG